MMSASRDAKRGQAKTPRRGAHHLPAKKILIFLKGWGPKMRFTYIERLWLTRRAALDTGDEALLR